WFLKIIPKLRSNPPTRCSSAGLGPMASTEHGRGLEEASTARKMVQQNPVRGGQTHRPAKRRRPRPRLSHKGPMPF
uniref:Apelin n=1 Tax=Nothobranchius furzeri TaxID=105023 RepID=A0A8C6K5J2_NOTFU